MASRYEVIIRTSLDARNLKSGEREVKSTFDRMAQRAAEVNKQELSLEKQRSAAASLQRQRSAALIADWKKQEAAAKALAAGIRPVNENLQSITNVMRTLGSSIGVLQGPLNGLSGRFTALGTLARSTSGELQGVGTAAAQSGGSIAAMAGPIGIAVVAIAALAAGAGLVVKGLFELAKHAADFRGKMFDMAQQTGVAVETLSTLEIVATTTGGSIDSIAQSLVIFQGKLDEAQDASSKTGVQFKLLGISTNNTESALRDALEVLAKMPVGFEQTNEAAELFGRRGGKQMLAILKEMDGDLDGTTAKLRTMGLVISEEDAKAADEFNDQLAILQFQFRSLLGREVIPAALTALQTLSTFLKDNREAVNALGQVFSFLSNVVLEQFLIRMREVNAILGALQTAAAALDRMRGISQSFRGVEGGAGGVDRLAELEGGAVSPKRIGGGGGVAKIAAGQQLLNQLTDEYNRLQAKTNELTKFDIVQKELQDKKYKNISASLRQQIEEMATYITIDTQLAEEKKKQVEAHEEVTKFIDKQNAAIREAQGLTDEWGDGILRLVGVLKAAGAKIDEKTFKTIKDNDATIKAIALTKQSAELGEIVGSLLQKGGLDVVQRAKETASDYAGIIDGLNGKLQQNLNLTQLQITLHQLEAAGLGDLSDARAQEAIALAQQIDQETELLKMRDRIRDVASDISSIFARATENWSGSFGDFFRDIGRGFSDLLKKMVADLVYAKLTGVFENFLGSLLGVATKSPAQAVNTGGIGSFLSRAVQSVFGGGGSSLSFAGTGSASQGISVPASISGQHESLHNLQGLLKTTQTAAPSATTGLGSLVAAAPMLGAAYGAATWMGILQGGVSPLQAATGGGILGFFVNRSIIRKKEEKARSQYSSDAYSAIIQILNATRAGELSGSAAAAEFQKVKLDYMAKANALTDSKTRRHAVDWWNNDFEPFYLPLIIQAGKDADAAKKFSSAFVPTFARGGDFVSRQIRSDFFVPRAARGLLEIPGMFDQRDDLLMRVSRGERVAVMTPEQYDRIGGRRTFEQAGIPALATGGSSGSSQSSLPPIVLQQSFSIDAKGMVTQVLKSPDGRRITVETMNNDVATQGMEGHLGVVAHKLTDRTR